MEPLFLGFASVPLIILLVGLRIPVGVAVGLVSFLGFLMVRNLNVALGVMRETPFAFANSWDLTAIPMFLLMGAITTATGISTAMFRAARLWLSALPGGLAVAANMACAGFGAATGSSVAASATMTRLAVPEMLRQGYDKGLATGVVASAGTLAALIPPSIMFVLFGIFAEVSISQLLIAGVIPGLLTAFAYTAMIVIRCWLKPSLAPPLSAVELASLKADRWSALRDTWPVIFLILGVIGGLYSGLVTPTEAGAVGAMVALLLGLAQRRMTFAALFEALRTSMSTAAQIFFVGMAAVMYTRFLSLTGMSGFLEDTFAPYADNPIVIILGMAVVYLLLGMFLDPLGTMLITIPVFLPLLNALDMNLIWFGVIVVKYIEIAMLTPPIGFNIFVVKAAIGNQVELNAIFKGTAWFLLAEVVVMILLLSFPQISLWLPNLMN
ncbi:TRAP transporter large permease [Halodurantibacterium flavum]|uniref:TRAP transporter large permease protein n=1 Tax=Halodurantibacterium flavum TaxID=1382802 RepID=A0ABW4S1C0_9RHOB